MDVVIEMPDTLVKRLQEHWATFFAYASPRPEGPDARLVRLPADHVARIERRRWRE